MEILSAGSAEGRHRKLVTFRTLLRFSVKVAWAQPQRRKWLLRLYTSFGVLNCKYRREAFSQGRLSGAAPSWTNLGGTSKCEGHILDYENHFP